MATIKLTIDGNEIEIDENDPRVPAIKEKIKGMSPEERSTLNFQRVEAPAPAPSAQDNRRRVLEDRMERQRAKPNPIAEGVGNFGRGVQRIATGDVAPQEIGDALETSIRSTTAPLGGDFLAAGGENIARFIMGDDINPNALAEQRGRREELAANDPINAGASEMLGFGGLFKAITGVAPGLTRVGQGSTIANPQRAVNAGRSALEGAVTTGVGRKAQGAPDAQAAQEAGIAAVASPLAGGLLRAVTQGAQGVPSGVRAARDQLDTSADEAGVRSLFQRLEMDPEEGLQRLADARSRGNPTPALRDLLNDREIDMIKGVTDSRRAAADILDEGETTAARTRSDEMRERIVSGQGGGRVRTQAVERLESNAGERLTNALRADRGAGRGTLADSPIDKQPFQDLFMDDAGEALRTSLSPNLRRQLSDALDGDADLTIDLAEQVRQALSKRGGSGENFRFVEASQAVRDIITNQSDEYASAFGRYKSDFDFIDGFKRGQNVVGKDSAELTDVFDTLSPQEQTGVRAGVRGKLSSTAGRRPGSAVRVADELADSRDIREILELTEGPQEASNLVALGEQARRSANNATRLSPSTTLPPALRDASEQLAEAAAAVGGRGSGILFARLAGNLVGNIRGLGVPPNAARAMANLLLDPARTQEVLERLNAMGIAEEQLTQLTQGIVSTMRGPATDKARRVGFAEPEDDDGE